MQLLSSLDSLEKVLGKNVQFKYAWLDLDQLRSVVTFNNKNEHLILLKGEQKIGQHNLFVNILFN